jgi:outer membrane biosynthesis protein TonB
MPSHTTASARDAALRRLRRTNRWLIAGSVALTGVLSDVAANAFSGKTIKASSTKHAGGRSTGASSSTQTQPLAPPAQPPQGTTSKAPPPQEPSQAAPSQESPQQPAPESQQPAPESQGPAPEAQQPAPPREAAPPAVSGGS